MECDGHCQGIELKFDGQYVQKKLDKYRRKGPKKTTLALIEALTAQNISGSPFSTLGVALATSSMRYCNRAQRLP